MAASGLITLTTDFGLSDAYVGALKGALLSGNSAATLVDITHDVWPQAIEQGAFLLSLAAPHFPPGTVHLAVVDPGVSTERRALAIQTASAFFVGPDNGVLSCALGEWPQAGEVSLPEGVAAVELSNREFFREPVSQTFHGRDIFAPVAAQISLGLPLQRLGPPVRSIQAVQPFTAIRQADGSLAGRVLHIDRFGNVVTSIRRRDLTEGGHIRLSILGREVPGLVSSYGAAPSGLCCLIGSDSYLEVALAGGNAAAELGAGIGDAVELRMVS